MKFKKQFLLLTALFASTFMMAQLIVDDEFTTKGMAPEGGFLFEEGNFMPNLRFKNLKSETFNLHDKLDKLTIIEFWYVGCASCVSNKKLLKKFSYQYNINVVSISVDDKPSSVRKFLADQNIHWDNIQDSSAFDSFYQKTRGVPVPIYLIVNEDKEIVKVLDKGGSDIGKMGVFLQNYF